MKKWKEVPDVGRRKAKCAGNGSVRKSKKLNVDVRSKRPSP